MTVFCCRINSDPIHPLGQMPTKVGLGDQSASRKLAGEAAGFEVGWGAASPRGLVSKDGMDWFPGVGNPRLPP